MDILDDMGVSKLSAKVFLKVKKVKSFFTPLKKNDSVNVKQTRTKCIILFWSKEL